MRAEKLARFLRALASAVERLDESQLDEFIADLGRGRDDNPVFASRKGAAKNRHSKVDPVQLEGILQKLIESSTRDEGAKLLDEFDLTRKELEKLARFRDIHVSKDDNVAKIKEKLVEVVIGSRLSSRAIRGP
jgi:hypothetical protein